MILLPGDTCSADRIGPGLHSTDAVRAIQTGLLSTAKTTTFLETLGKRYVATQGDSVIGQITARFGDLYRVDIASAVPGTLDVLAFYNVNRKNRPNLQPGHLVYARVTSSSSGMEPELVCFSAENKEAGYGHLEGGYCIKNVPLLVCRRLLSSSVLQWIGEYVEYEVVVGMNGRVWVSGDNETIIRIVKLVGAIVDGSVVTESDVRKFMK